MVLWKICCVCFLSSFAGSYFQPVLVVASESNSRTLEIIKEGTDVPQDGAKVIRLNWDTSNVENSINRSSTRITTFPRAGKLYQYDESKRDEKGDQLNGFTTKVFSWASKVVRFSSQNSTCESDCQSWNNSACQCKLDEGSASQILGAPDVYPRYEETDKGWTPGGADDGMEFIELEFPFEMYINGLELYEVFKPGAVYRISTTSKYEDDTFVHCTKPGVSDISECSEDSNWQTLWSKPRELLMIGNEKAQIFEPPICLRKEKTKIIRIDLDTSMVPGFNSYDAMKLTGTLEFPPGLIKDSQNRLVYLPREGIHGSEEVSFFSAECFSEGAVRNHKLEIEIPDSGKFSSSAFYEENLFLFSQSNQEVKETIDFSPALYLIQEVLGVEPSNMRGELIHVDVNVSGVETGLQFDNISLDQPEISLLIEANNYLKLEFWLTDSSSNLTFRLQYTFIPCENGETTINVDGEEFCSKEDSSLTPQLIILGYVATGLSYGLSVFFLLWIIRNRNDKLVKVSQAEFLVLICIGAMISSSTLIAFQPSINEDTDRASIGCRIAPFLYTIGWVLMYSSLSAKTFRLYKIMRNNENGKPKIVSFWSTIPIVLVALIVDLVIVITLTYVNPLEYEIGEEVYDYDTMTSSVQSGQCMTKSSEPRFWAFALALIGFHLFLLVTTRFLLMKVQKMKDRYQESKYISIAMGLVFEALVVGFPLLIAVKDMVVLDHILSMIIIVLHDIGFLCFIFIPKVLSQRKGSSDNADREESLILASLQKISAISLDEEMMNGEPKNTQGGLGRIIRDRISTKNTIRFVLKEFAGMDDDSIGEGYERAPLSKNSSRTAISQNDENLYIPPEFQQLTQKNALFQLLSWTSLKHWDFNIFDISTITGGHPLLFVGWAILGSPYSQYSMAKACGQDDVTVEDFRGYKFMKSNLKIPMKTLCDYLRAIESDYNPEIPFHNAIHAADVLQSLHALIQMKGNVFEATTDDLFSILLAAAVHDVNHPGKNNAFQVNARTSLALVYNDRSVLENRHASHAFARMLGVNADKPDSQAARNDDLNPLQNLPLKHFLAIRAKMVEAILRTDMSVHFQCVKMVQGIVVSHKNHEGKYKGEAAWIILQYMLHVADISNPTKSDPLFKLWMERCLEEFFAQGDLEAKMGLPISPNCDRNTTEKADSQIGFIKFIILPAYEALGVIIPEVQKRIIPQIQSNLVYWEGEQIEESTSLHLSAKMDTGNQSDPCARIA